MLLLISLQNALGTMYLPSRGWGGGGNGDKHFLEGRDVSCVAAIFQSGV